VTISEGLSRCTAADCAWMIESARWTFLQYAILAREEGLVASIHAEQLHQKELEAQGYRSVTWAVLRAAAALMGATVLQGETAVSALPCFETAGRGSTAFWGLLAHGPMLILADLLSATLLAQRNDWVVLCMKPATGALASGLQKYGRQVARTGHLLSSHNLETLNLKPSILDFKP